MANALEDQLRYRFGDHLPDAGATLEVVTACTGCSLRIPLPFGLLLKRALTVACFGHFGIVRLS